MSGRRLVSASQVDVWGATLRAALADAADVQRRAVGEALGPAGLSWGSPAAQSPAQLWSQPAWADTVARVVEPVAAKVAGEVLAAVKSRVPARWHLGMADPTAQLVALVTGRALAGGSGVARRIQASGLTASAGWAKREIDVEAIRAKVDAAPSRYGGVLHPDSQSTIADAYQAAFDQLNDLVANVGSHMSNAAAAILGENAVQTSPEAVQHQWSSVGDDRTRDAHLDADGQVQDAGDPFDVGGEELMYPGDPNGSDENICNCVAEGTTVALPGLRAAMRRWHQGDLVRVRFASGHELAVTPNHPVLRAGGQWSPAGGLNVGDHCVSGRLVWSGAGQPDVESPPTEVGEIFRSTELVGDSHRVRAGVPNFHGDGSDSDVDVASPHVLLRHHGDAASDEEVRQFGLAAADAARTAASRSLAASIPLSTDQTWAASHEPLFAPGVVGGGRKLAAFFGGSGRHPDGHRGAAATGVDAPLVQPASDGAPIHAESASEGEFALTLDVATDEVVHVEVDSLWAGWVYNFDTGHGWYVTGNGIVVGNCRCYLTILSDSVSAASEDDAAAG